MMHEPEKSDSSIVATKPANKSEQSEAEPVEPREGAKGNTSKPHTHRTRSRDSVSTGLERVRERAKANKKERFTALGLGVHSMSKVPFSGTGEALNLVL
jgi:RNA-directed DNA polymerase